MFNIKMNQRDVLNFRNPRKFEKENYITDNRNSIFSIIGRMHSQEEARNYEAPYTAKGDILKTFKLSVLPFDILLWVC
jgi:hypothetical protein